MKHILKTGEGLPYQLYKKSSRLMLLFLVLLQLLLIYQVILPDIKIEEAI